MLFVQRLQSLITFQSIAFMKANIVTSLRDSALGWYTSELSNIDRDALNNDSGMKNWVNTLFHYFKVPISVAFAILTNEMYSFDNAQAQ